MLSIEGAVVFDRLNISDEAATALNIYNLCKRFGTLPHQGGLFDQDYYYVWLFGIIEYCYNKRESQQMSKTRK